MKWKGNQNGAQGKKVSFCQKIWELPDMLPMGKMRVLWTEFQPTWDFCKNVI